MYVLRIGGGFLALAILLTLLYSCGGGKPSTGGARHTPTATYALTPTQPLGSVSSACATPAASSSGRDIEAMQLLTDASGWVLADQRLMWTDDGGATWRDITPPDLKPSDAKFGAGELGYFLDASNGWVLATRPHDSRTPSDLIIWRTADAGMTWYSTRLDGPAVDPTVAPPTFYPLALQFVDAQVGWFVLAYAGGMLGSSQFFGTDDGGASWRPLAGLQGLNGSWGPVRLVSVDAGWEVWNFGEGDVAVTHDGGRSWQMASLPQPAGLGDAQAWVNQEGHYFAEGPAMGPDDGVIPANHYGGDDPDNPKAGLYVTQNAGRSWTFAGRAPGNGGAMFFISPETWVQAAGNLYVTDNGGADWQAIAVDWPQAVGMSSACVFEPQQIAFADLDHGWALLSSKGIAGVFLVTTENGGRSWHALAP